MAPCSRALLPLTLFSRDAFNEIRVALGRSASVAKDGLVGWGVVPVMGPFKVGKFQNHDAAEGRLAFNGFWNSAGHDALTAKGFVSVGHILLIWLDGI